MNRKPGPKPVDGQAMVAISVNMPRFYRLWFAEQAKIRKIHTSEILREALKEYVDKKRITGESWER